MYNPATYVNIPRVTILGSYYFKKTL
jgi:hypothetical protein